MTRKGKKASRARQNEVSGNGDYKVILRALQKLVPKGTAEAAGRGAGTLAGRIGQSYTGLPMASLGALGGAALGRKFASVTGVGDYTVRSNSLASAGYAIPPGEPVPAFGRSDHRLRVRHREFLGNIVVPATPSDFSSSDYRLDVSDPATFPWLHRLVKNYGSWKVHGALASFISNTSGYSASGPLGSLALATRYDPTSEEFNSMSEMMNSMFAVTAAPSCNQQHPIECHPDERPLEWMYTASAPRAIGSENPRFTSLGVLQVATEGLPGSAGDVIGGLWITFDVELDKPINNPKEGQHITGTNVAVNNLFETGEMGGLEFVEPTAVQKLRIRAAGDYAFSIHVSGTNPLVQLPTGSVAQGTMWSGTEYLATFTIPDCEAGDVLDFTGTTGTCTTVDFTVCQYNRPINGTAYTV